MMTDYSDSELAWAFAGISRVEKRHVSHRDGSATAKDYEIAVLLIEAKRITDTEQGIA